MSKKRYLFLGPWLFLCSMFDTVFGGEAKLAFPQSWDRLLEAAKKEGQVNVYISGYSAILPTFQRDYPSIKVVGVTGQGVQIAQRIMAERRAGKYLADVVSAGSNPNYQLFYKAKMLEPLSPSLILPEVSDESKWYEGKHRYLDPEFQYVFAYVGNASTGGLHYNTRLVNPRELRSYWDILTPKWKGKIVMRDPRIPGSGSNSMRWMYYERSLGPEFVRRLFSEVDITLTRDFRQGADWLAQGRFALCFFCPDIARAKSQGLPVDSLGLLTEGGHLSRHFGTVVLMSRGPHPNAGRLFVNWLLSRRGQVVLQKEVGKSGETESPDSLRVDIPKDDVSPDYRRVAGVNYLDIDREEWLDREPLLKLINEALAEGKRR